MARKSSKLELTDKEKAKLQSIVKKGTHKSRKIIRAHALLKMDAGFSKSEIMLSLGIDSNHYHRIKSRYFLGGLENSLEEKPRTGQPSKITERLEAQITSISCSDAPEGRSSWTLSLINERLVELNYIEDLSNETIRKVLKKVNLNPG
jgi:putative transposase